MPDTNPMLKIVPDSEATESSGRTTPDTVFIVDAQGTVLYVNRALPTVAQDDVLGTSLYDYIKPEHHMAVRTEIERVFTTGEDGGYEILGMQGDASTEWYDCRVVPTMRGGRVVSATVIGRDITLRKRVEEGLRRELEDTKRQLAGVEADLHRVETDEPVDGDTIDRSRLLRFREVMDQAGEAVFFVDPYDGRILDANGTGCKWVSHRLEDLLTQKEADLRLQFPLRVPEEYGDHVTETRDLQRPQIFHGEHRRSDGSAFPVEVSLTRHRVDGREIILAVARDAKDRQVLETRLNETEDRYRALFELSRDSIYLSNRDGTVAEANDTAAEFFGMERATFEGYPARDLYVNTEDIREFQKTVAREGYVRDMEAMFMRADGTHFRGLLTATLRRSGRDVLGYQCVIRKAPERPDKPGPPTRESIETAAQTQGTVLLIDDVARDRSEAQHVLELAGVRVLIGESLAEALIIMRSRSREINVLMVAATPDDIVADSAFAEIRRAAPHARVVLLTSETVDERSAVEHLAHANLSGVVPKPVHPLALIQRTRDALEAGTPPATSTRRHTPRVSRAMEATDDEA